MKSISRASGANIFLLEILIAILIFAIAATVCVQIFLYASAISDKSTDLNNAIINAESCAECFKATAGDAKEIASVLNYDYKNNTVFAYYDINWQQTTKKNSAYSLILTCTAGENNQICGEISIKNHNDASIYSLSLAVLEVENE